METNEIEINGKMWKYIGAINKYGWLMGIVFLVLCLLFPMHADHQYGWFMGIVHGLVWLPNWILSWFSSSYFVKAPLHTGAYNFFWWLNFILSLIGWVEAFIPIILSLFRKVK
ncbi:MAG: hypothetical protein IJ524_00465 [Bacteroidales bacterium]|nr:hypothetical protein [Bacteroidales bacterium]